MAGWRSGQLAGGQMKKTDPDGFEKLALFWPIASRPERLR